MHRYRYRCYMLYVIYSILDFIFYILLYVIYYIILYILYGHLFFVSLSQSNLAGSVPRRCADISYIIFYVVIVFLFYVLWQFYYFYEHIYDQIYLRTRRGTDPARILKKQKTTLGLKFYWRFDMAITRRPRVVHKRKALIFSQFFTKNDARQVPGL